MSDFISFDRIEVENAFNEQLEQKRLEIVCKKLIELEFAQVDDRNWSKHEFVAHLDKDDEEELQELLKEIDELDKSKKYEYTIGRFGGCLLSIRNNEKSSDQTKDDEAEKEFNRVSRRTRKEL